MSIPLFVREGTGPQITTRPLSVGCLIYAQMDQIDFTEPFILRPSVWATARNFVHLRMFTWLMLANLAKLL